MRTPTKEQAAEAAKTRVPQSVKVLLWSILAIPIVGVVAAEIVARAELFETRDADIAEPTTKRLYGDRVNEPWPFTVPYVDLHCEHLPNFPNLHLVTLTHRSQTYALNGTAASHAEARGWHKLEEIWRVDPDLPGARVSVGFVLKTGLALCAK
jgi:Protein of unknown function (DUF2511)